MNKNDIDNAVLKWETIRCWGARRKPGTAEDIGWVSGDWVQERHGKSVVKQMDFEESSEDDEQITVLWLEVEGGECVNTGMEVVMSAETALRKVQGSEIIGDR